jgi:hypothetical protein
LLFFLMALPFLGMNTIRSQYSFLPNIGLVIILSLIAHWLYRYLRETQDKVIASAGITIIFLIFTMTQVFQIQSLEDTREKISKKSEQFLISFGEHYSDAWRHGQWNFYFVNVPDDQGEPWVEPLSLLDAIWFVTQNPKTNIHVEDDLNKALNIAQMDPNVRVFEFQSDGSVLGVIRKTVKGKTVIIKK